MRYFSMFSGIGGFEIAMQEVGWRCIGFSEIDKYAIEIYKKHFPKHKNYGDATKINPATLPDFDLLCGGFPCQSFSIAGKRKGFADTRGTLFFDIARIIKEKRPEYILLENVKGLLSHDGGRTFKTIISTLAELGYDLQWQVLNSKYFGVPQNRERVFIIGNLRGTSRPKIFPFKSEPALSNNSGSKEEQIFTALRAKQGGPDIDATYIAVPALRASDSKRGDNQTTVIEDFYPGRVREFKGSPTLRSGRSGLKIRRGGGYESNIRRLTPKECERLQGFPDGWTEGISDTQRYKTIGNAVTVNVIREIIKKSWINLK